MKEKSLVLGLTRISLGLIFLWAFFDKVFGLGFATTTQNAWINGGSPTTGFLLHGTQGPFATIFQSITGPITDWLFMLGLLGIGLGLTLGIARELASYSGALLLTLMWLAILPPEHHPLLDEHVIYTLILLYLARRETPLSITNWWNRRKVVKKHFWLKG